VVIVSGKIVEPLLWTRFAGGVRFVLIKIAKVFLGIFLVAPCVGGLVGFIVACITIHALEASIPFLYVLGIAAFHGATAGAFLGLLLGGMVVWPLRNESPAAVILYLAGGSLLPGVLAALCLFLLPGPDRNPLLPIAMTILGFWMGLALLHNRAR
jgi:hypothetical protein